LSETYPILDIKACWRIGSSHDWIESSFSPAHQFIYRFGYGRGREATNSSVLVDRKWCANEISYLAPGSEYLHSTEFPSDWIIFSLDSVVAESSFLYEQYDHFRNLSGAVARLNPQTEALIGQIRAALMRMNDTSSMLLEEDCNNLISNFISTIQGRKTSIKRHRLNKPTLRRITCFVDDNLARSLSIADLAQLSKCSPYHFAKAFRAETGQSPHQFVIERRLAKSRELLRSNKFAISDVALATGFGSQSHFQTSFREHFGLTPGQYVDHRQKYRTKSSSD